jgi:hypothetical protein
MGRESLEGLLAEADGFVKRIEHTLLSTQIPDKVRDEKSCEDS